VIRIAERSSAGRQLGPLLAQTHEQVALVTRLFNRPQDRRIIDLLELVQFMAAWIARRTIFRLFQTS
jgi:hypothetical protein